jgi:hypothetical protein
LREIIAICNPFLISNFLSLTIITDPKTYNALPKYPTYFNDQIPAIYTQCTTPKPCHRNEAIESALLDSLINGISEGKRADNSFKAKT